MESTHEQSLALTRDKPAARLSERRGETLYKALSSPL
jgi:hypothetical protein